MVVCTAVHPDAAVGMDADVCAGDGTRGARAGGGGGAAGAGAGAGGGGGGRGEGKHLLIPRV